MTQKFAVLITCCWLALMSAAVAADEPQPGDRVSFQVEAGQDVENDRVVAVLAATAEDRDPAALADTINQAMSWALERARSEEKVKPRTASYQTYPVYDERKIVRWRARQELQLESQDVDRLSRLIGTLQERLQLQALQFSVSAERRRTVEEGLVEQALAGFQKRAGVIAAALGATGYELVTLDIRTGDHDRPVPVRAEAMSLAARSTVAPPAVESGTSRIDVQVAGTIGLLRGKR